jgi:glutamine amidotransferase
VLLQKRPAPGPVGLEELVGAATSEIFVAVSHRIGPHGFVEEGTSPYRLRHWLFAGVGRVLPVGERAHVAASLPEFLQRGLEGTTDAELAFRVALGHVHASSRRLDHPDLEPSVVCAAMAKTIAQLDARARESGAPAPRTASVFTNGRVLVAARRGRPLYYRLVEGLAVCGRCGVLASTPETDPRVRPHRTLKGVVIASSVTSGRWLEVPEGAALAIGRDYAVTVAPLVVPADA